MVQDEQIQALMDLGLSLLQAKIYLSLASFENAPIRTISKASNIAKQDIYRIMPALQKIGLVEKILGAPIRYQAIPLKAGIATLFQCKTKEYAELQNKTAQVLNTLQESNSVESDQDEPKVEEEQLLITSEITLLLKKLEKENRSAQKSIDTAGPWKDTKRALYNYLQWEFRKIMKKGVKIRFLTEEHENDQTMERTIKALEKNPLFRIRYVPAPIMLRTAIYDKKHVNVYLGASLDDSVPSLWSNNLRLVKIMDDYFEELWNSAHEDKSDRRPKLEKMNKGANLL